jgi:hypothetical protein
MVDMLLAHLEGKKYLRLLSERGMALCVDVLIEKVKTLAWWWLKTRKKDF